MVARASAKILRLVAIVCLSNLMQAACARNDAPVRRAGDRIFITGEIEAATAFEFSRRFDRGIKEIVVNSAGGDERAAIAIAKSIAKRSDILLRVRDQCMSACLQYIFVAASRKIVEPNAIVGCHSNSLGLSKADMSVFENASRNGFQENASETIALYRDVGVSVDFAFACTYMVAPLCGCKSEEGPAIFFDLYDIWIPTIEDLAAYGIRDVFGVPSLRQQASEIAQLRGGTAEKPPREIPQVHLLSCRKVNALSSRCA